MDNKKQEQRIISSAAIITTIILFTIILFLRWEFTRKPFPYELLNKVNTLSYQKGEYNAEREIERTVVDEDVPYFIKMTISENYIVESKDNISHITGFVSEYTNEGGNIYPVNKYRIFDTKNNTLTWMGEDLTFSNNTIKNNGWYSYSLSENSLVEEMNKSRDITGLFNINNLTGVILEEDYENNLYIVTGIINGEDLYKDLGVVLNLEGTDSISGGKTLKTFYFDKDTKEFLGLKTESTESFSVNNDLIINNFNIFYKLTERNKDKSISINSINNDIDTFGDIYE